MEFKYYGYVRTTSFLKTTGMLRPEQIKSISMSRGVHRSIVVCDKCREKVVCKCGQEIHGGVTERIAKYGLTRTRTFVDDFVVGWDTRREGGIFPAEKFRKLIETAMLGDYVIEDMQVEFVNCELAKYLNSEYLEGRLQLPLDCKFYATFHKMHTAELGGLFLLKELNKQDYMDYGFKVSCLDLTELKTQRAINYGETETLPVTSDVRLIKLVLGSPKLKSIFEFSGWSEASRTWDEKGNKHIANPVAVRQYRMTKGSDFQLTGEIEVD